MKIGVIGGGVSGITFAINRKRYHQEDEIIVFEHLSKILKKVLATGNGKCNIGNKLDISCNQDSLLVKNILQSFDYDRQKDFLNSLNIKTKLVNDLEYPISESASTVRNAYLKAVEKYNIDIKLNSVIQDYYLKNNVIYLKTNEGDFQFDKLVIATGGKSSPKLGSDGSFVDIIDKHGYNTKPFVPALCPIYTKEKTKILDGTRVKSIVRLLKNGIIIFDEYGEVLFKDRGLSGIVIFNASRYIAKDKNQDYEIKIDLLPETNVQELKLFLKDHDEEELLDAYLHPNLVQYVSSLNSKDIIQTIKSLSFHYNDLYGFDNSQISVGGLPLSKLNDDLESKIEKGVYFLGELLDYDAPCGGYNLMWAIGSALYLSEKIKK